MDPKLRAVHSARFVIEWLRTAKQRKEGHLAMDEDAAAGVEELGKLKGAHAMMERLAEMRAAHASRKGW